MPRRRAHARERRPVVDADVVGVETGEPARLALPGRLVLANSRMPGSCPLSAPPFAVRARGRVVDVRVGDAGGREAHEAAAPSAAGVRPAKGSTCNATRSPAARAARRRAAAGRLGRAGTPPRDDHGLDADRRDLAHLRTRRQPGRTTSRRREREPVRRDLQGGFAVLLPVLPGAVAAPRCRTRGSRRSPPRPGRHPSAGRRGLAAPGTAHDDCRSRRHRRQ